MDSRRRLGGNRKSSSGQAPVLAAILFLLLVPTTIILAENATMNITGSMLANLTFNATQPNISLPVNNSTPTNDTNTTIPENNTEPLNITIPLNIPLPSNETSPEANTTGPMNETNVTEPEEKTSPPEEPEEETLPETPEGPVLEVSLDIPERADRNQEFQVSATVSNTGGQDASDVELEWVLPEGFLITQGSGTKTCNIPSSAACSSTLTVAASLSSMLGEQDIKILVRYHD